MIFFIVSKDTAIEQLEKAEVVLNTVEKYLVTRWKQ